MAVAVVRGPSGERNIDEGPAVVAIERIADPVIGHVEIQIAVRVNVAGQRPQALAKAVEYPRLFGDIDKGSAIVAVEHIRDAIVAARAAIGAQCEGNFQQLFAPALGGDSAAANAVVGRIEVEVIGRVEVEVAIVIEVKKQGTGAPARIPHTGFFGDIDKRAAVVAIKDVGTVVGDVEIWVAIRVNVADSHAHAIASIACSGRIFYLAKRPVSPVAVESIPPG